MSWQPSFMVARTSSRRCSTAFSKLSTARTTNDHDLRHFIYYIDRHIELDGDSHGPKGKRLLEDLLKNAPGRAKRAMRTACSSIEARIALWNGTLGKLRDGHNVGTAALA